MKFKQEDVERMWDAYEKIHGTQPLTKDEVVIGVKKLLRAGGAASRNGVAIKWVTGRNQTHFVTPHQFNVNLERTDWRDVVHHVAWRCNEAGKHTPSIEMKLARRVCEKNWLIGVLKPQPKPKVMLDPAVIKSQRRAEKIDRLNIRRESWQKKLERARNAIKKIDRSLRAYRRHEQ